MVTNKNKSKVSKVINLFKPTSFKGGMALFALVFAVIGGGIVVYRSFATSSALYTLTVGADGMSLKDGATLQHDTSISSKSGANAVGQIKVGRMDT